VSLFTLSVGYVADFHRRNGLFLSGKFLSDLRKSRRTRFSTTRFVSHIACSRAYRARIFAKSSGEPLRATCCFVKGANF
jgi:hypothetical protein